MFSKITYHRNLGTTPARVNRKTGELQINLPVWDTLSTEGKRFVMLHEEGHLALQTRDELKADNYAIARYLKEGHSPREAVKTMAKILNNSPVHLKRSTNILQTAAMHEKYSSMDGIWIAQAWENATGKKAARQAKRAERKEARQEKRTERKEAKTDRREARKDLRVQRKEDKNERRNTKVNSRAEQRLLLAEQGTSAGGLVAAGIGSTIDKVNSSLSNVAGLMTGGGMAPAFPTTNMPSLSPAEMEFGAGSGGGGGFFDTASSADMGQFMPGNFGAPQQQQKNNLPLIIGGAVAVLVVVFFALRK